MIIETLYSIGDMVYFLHNDMVVYHKIYKLDISVYEDRISTYLIFRNGEEFIVKNQDNVYPTLEEVIQAKTQTA
jgi:hypothetical protein